MGQAEHDALYQDFLLIKAGHEGYHDRMDPNSIAKRLEDALLNRDFVEAGLVAVELAQRLSGGGTEPNWAMYPRAEEYFRTFTTPSFDEARHGARCSGCGGFLEVVRHVDGTTNRCDSCTAKAVSAGGTVEIRRRPMLNNIQDLITETLHRVARSSNPRSEARRLVNRVLGEDTDVGKHSSGVEDGRDEVVSPADMTGPDPIGSAGTPPQGEAEGTPFSTDVASDPAAAEPGEAPKKLAAAPTDGEENSFAAEARVAIERYLRLREEGEKGDDDDDGEDDKKEKDDDDKKEKADDDKKEKADEAWRRRSGLKGRRLRESDGTFQVGTTVVWKGKDATVTEKYPHAQGVVYHLEVRGEGTVLANHGDVTAKSPIPGDGPRLS
jgi:hypothetical protein